MTIVITNPTVEPLTKYYTEVKLVHERNSGYPDCTITA
jgi:hypothetical protein